MASTPTLVESLRRALDARASEICTAIPARVESYDSETQRCSAQPLIRRGFEDETGARQAERLPVITDVPVVFPGAGSYSITFPVAKGDSVLLVFSQASLDKWLSGGGDVDPLDDRKHALTDAIAIPGLRHRAHPSGGIDAAALVITAPQIHAGGTEALATKADVDDLADWIHTVMVVNATGATAGTTTAPPSASGTSILKGA